MCGIVGHLGPQNSVEKVLLGLQRLEYRGYDSAGVAICDEHQNLHLYKKTGKLQNLKDYLGNFPDTIVARSCIGHTRWATHGKVTDSNSHPHHWEHLALVHNGIIENATKLRQELESDGFEFKSETDSEVFVYLLAKKLKEGKSLKSAISLSFKEIEGNSAFVILDSKHDEIFSIKRGAPLVCGKHRSSLEVLVSSDPYALVGLADDLYFPEDEVLCSLSNKHKDCLEFYNLDGEISHRYLFRHQELASDVTDKGDFEHFMLKEIFEQPELIRSLIQYYFDGDGVPLLRSLSTNCTERVHIVACGTAAYAGLLIGEYLEQLNKIPCRIELASEFRYKNPLIKSGDLGLFISQSGETADTLAAADLCLQNEIKTLSIVNVEGSTLFRNCDENLLIRAGVEVGVASTKAYTLQALTGRLFSYALEGNFDQVEKKKALLDKFFLLAERIEGLLSRFDEIKQIAECLYNCKGFFFTGRGAYYHVALEGALKLKEIAYVHAEGYASGELKHGPIALIDEEMVNIAIVAPFLYDKTVSNIQEIKARKGIILSIGPLDDENLKKMSDYYIGVDFYGLEELAPLYVNVVNQLLAYSMAKFKGTDIDRPRNLAKSVTVE